MSPSKALKHIHTLIDGSDAINNERQQRLLLQAIEEIARKGLEQPKMYPSSLLSFYRPKSFRWQ